ncbi:MAG: hypothetical protein P1U83_10550 [Roseovarius sp.]|nr:hypothetical protein [Roseovarius sp.]
MRKVAGMNRRVTLVRGAGAGTGFATAHQLATKDYLDPSAAAQAVADLGPDHITVPGDVANEEEAKLFVVKTVALGYLA